MNEIKIFENSDFGRVRTMVIENEPWFVAKDVCEVFGETNYRRSIGKIDDEEKGVSQINTPGGMQQMTTVNESGLYSLLFAMQPEKARGVTDEYIAERQLRLKKFKKWVTSEVLPSIRKHGAYMTPAVLEEALLNPDTIIKIATALKDEQTKNKELSAINSNLTVEKTIMQPKAEYFDELVDRNLLTGVRETAKELGIKQGVFVNFLLEKKYVFRNKKGNLEPYAPFVQKGLFELKECYNEKTTWNGTQMLITPKGRETFRLLFLRSA